jgi:EAL domain-containing protein (putative c-di-GMP-specific phosphodiesterase class I)
VVIAEGVEREEEMRALVELGVMLQQGFYFGLPKEY